MIRFIDIIQGYYPTTSKVLLEYVEGALKNFYKYPNERKYHNWEHVENSLIELEAIHKEHTVIEKDIIALAIFYHDCIYEPLEKDNEERSAERAFIDLSALGFTLSQITKVYELILLTRHTHECSYYSGQVLMDIDLAILGKDFSIFEKYENDIRAEYASVPDLTYKAERIKFLVSILQKPKIYQTEYFKSKYESNARSNIIRIMNVLREGLQMKDLFPTPLSK